MAEKFFNGQLVIDKSGERFTYVGPYPHDNWFAVVLDEADELQAVLVQYLESTTDPLGGAT